MVPHESKERKRPPERPSCYPPDLSLAARRAEVRSWRAWIDETLASLPPDTYARYPHVVEDVWAIYDAQTAWLRQRPPRSHRGSLALLVRHHPDRLTPQGDNFRALCPYHADRHPSLTVYPDGHYHCWVCQAHGSAADLDRTWRNQSREDER